MKYRSVDLDGPSIDGKRLRDCRGGGRAWTSTREGGAESSLLRGGKADGGAVGCQRPVLGVNVRQRLLHHLLGRTAPLLHVQLRGDLSARTARARVRTT